MRTVTSRNGLRWSVKRLIVPNAMRPLSRYDLLDAAAPRRTTVDGMSSRVPDAMGASTGPLPLGFLFTLAMLPLVPIVLVLRALRLLPWTIEARAYPWGKRYPPVVLAYAVRGRAESARALDALTEALGRGEGSPAIAGAERIRESSGPGGGRPVVGTGGPKQFGK